MKSETYGLNGVKQLDQVVVWLRLVKSKNRAKQNRNTAVASISLN